MGSVNISSDDISFKDFENGNSIQVRVIVSEQEQHDYKKKKTIKVNYNGNEAIGKIVSEPILIDEKRTDGKKELSLIVERSVLQKDTVQ